METPKLSLMIVGNRVAIQSPASIVALVHSSTNDESNRILETCNSVYKNNEINLYVIDQQENYSALRLLNIKAPSIIAFKNGKPLCFLQSAITPYAIIEFWNSIVSMSDDTNNKTNEMIVNKTNTDLYKTFVQ